MSLIRKLYFLLLSLGISRFLSTDPSFTMESIESCDFTKMLQISSIATTRTVYDTTTSLASRESTTASTFELLGADPKETFDEPSFGKELSDLSADGELIIGYFQLEKFVGTRVSTIQKTIFKNSNRIRVSTLLNYRICLCIYLHSFLENMPPNSDRSKCSPTRFSKLRRLSLIAFLVTPMRMLVIGRF